MAAVEDVDLAPAAASLLRICLDGYWELAASEARNRLEATRMAHELYRLSSMLLYQDVEGDWPLGDPTAVGGILALFGDAYAALSLRWDGTYPEPAGLERSPVDSTLRDAGFDGWIEETLGGYGERLDIAEWVVWHGRGVPFARSDPRLEAEEAQMDRFRDDEDITRDESDAESAATAATYPKLHDWYVREYNAGAAAKTPLAELAARAQHVLPLFRSAYLWQVANDGQAEVIGAWELAVRLVRGVYLINSVGSYSEFVVLDIPTPAEVEEIAEARGLHEWLRELEESDDREL